MKLRTLTATLVLASLSLFSHTAFADSAGGNVTVVLTASAVDPIEIINLDQTTPIFSTPIGTDGLFEANLADPLTDGPIVAIDTANVAGDADPFIDLNFTVTNTFNFNADITVTSFVPLTDTFGPDLQVDASASASVFDMSDNGFFLSPIDGTSIFEGRIDGQIVTTFFDAGTSGPVSQPAGSGNGGAGFLAFPINDLLPSAIAEESIGITSHFTLGPGDTARFRGSFAVVPVVPEPTSLMLLGLGTAAMAVNRRRSRST